MSSAEALRNSSDKVAVGSTVEIEWDDGERGVYAIGEESNLARNVIAADAPLARAIYGANAGDVRTYLGGRGLRTVRVLRVGGSTGVA
jgi:transcription elongation GreA/GreB family factor